MSDVSEMLRVYLGAPGTIPGIGAERGKPVLEGAARYKSPHGSTRYVWYEQGTAVSALQVVSHNGKTATVANVYTLPSHRRRGLARILIGVARNDFHRVDHADETNLSSAGRAWRANVR
jgi:GNAT superfamily N-acetyltransferase